MDPWSVAAKMRDGEGSHRAECLYTLALLYPEEKRATDIFLDPPPMGSFEDVIWVVNIGDNIVSTRGRQ